MVQKMPQQYQWRPHHWDNTSLAARIWARRGKTPKVPNRGILRWWWGGGAGGVQSHIQQPQLLQLVGCGQMRYPEPWGYLLWAFIFVCLWYSPSVVFIDQPRGGLTSLKVIYHDITPLQSRKIDSIILPDDVVCLNFSCESEPCCSRCMLCTLTKDQSDGSISHPW